MIIHLTPRRNLRRWHRWFAWYPVRAGNTVVWLEHVERQVQPGGFGDQHTNYRSPRLR